MYNNSFTHNNFQCVKSAIKLFQITQDQCTVHCFDNIKLQIQYIALIIIRNQIMYDS